MATRATAQDAVLALRRKIAKMEGALVERLQEPESRLEETGADRFVVRRQGIPQNAVLKSGLKSLDAATGGFPASGLIELHGNVTRDAGAVAGFGLALSRILYRTDSLPLIWIGTSDVFNEAGRPYPPGLLQRFGIGPRHFLMAEASRIADALWIAEEAASLSKLGAVMVELRGNPRQLDLTATRRLHRRALTAGYPLVLLHQAGTAEPTAAPLRLIVASAPAAPRATLSGTLSGSIGPPAFHVTISKSRTAMPAAFTLEWDHDACAFRERHAPENPVALVPAIAGRAGNETAPRPVMAFASTEGSAAAGVQRARKQHAANRNARHAG